ncbi:MAG: 2-amino-4-hydroxy-6-hydroxymethyldihydropteridine diphosphokinase [Flavobacteriales bacterium]
MAEHTVYLCIGGNLGERLDNLEETRDFLTFNFGDIEAESSIYETEAWGMQDTPPFLNQVIQLKTELSVEELLKEISELEEFYGRDRSGEGYQSREMDVDILFYDDLVREDEVVIVPHPRLHLRKFVLVPLAEIAPQMIHPRLLKSVSELLRDSEDSGEAHKFKLD